MDYIINIIINKKKYFMSEIIIEADSLINKDSIENKKNAFLDMLMVEIYNIKQKTTNYQNFRDVKHQFASKFIDELKKNYDKKVKFKTKNDEEYIISFREKQKGDKSFIEKHNLKIVEDLKSNIFVYDWKKAYKNYFVINDKVQDEVNKLVDEKLKSLGLENIIKEKEKVESNSKIENEAINKYENYSKAELLQLANKKGISTSEADTKKTLLQKIEVLEDSDF